MKTTAYKKIQSLADNRNKRVFCIQGSQGAGKTFAILQMLISLCLVRGNKKVIVCQKQLTKMKLTVIADFKNIMKGAGIFDDKQWNKSSNTYTFYNDSTINFIGLDKEDIGKGLRCDVIYLNEANKISFETYRQLSSRAKKVVFDYNADFRFWAHDDVIPQEDCAFMKLTFEDNEYLSNEERQVILGYREQGYNEDGTVKNEYWANIWLVYGRGEIGRLVGTIFTNVSNGDFDETIPFCYGMDFGLTDPTAIVRVAVDNHRKVIYADEILYLNGLSTEKIADEIKRNVKGKIVGDSAASQTIHDLRKIYGVDIIESKKNKIVDDIRMIQSYKIIATKRSVNLMSNFTKYIWIDGKNEIPIDKDNHAIDALRYGFVYLTNASNGIKKISY